MASSGNKVDLISNLPSEIIEKILTHLPVDEAGRTSVLARTWRYRWTTMPDLNFMQSYFDRMKVVIDGCLHLHQGPIRKFSVRSWLRTPTEEQYLQQWLCLVLKPDLEELDVDTGLYYYSFRIPAYLFNCKRLTHLKLCGCDKLFVPATFEGFPNLKILDILFRSSDCVDSKIGILISKSPLLESLSLDFCSPSNNNAITISAPKLKYFKLQGQFKDIHLENTSVLVDVIINHFSYRNQCNVVKFVLGGAPNVERLTIHYFNQNFESGLHQGVLSTTFNYLKIMRLACVSLQKMEGIPVLELITSAPNLEKLVINYPRDVFSSKEQVKSTCWQKEYSPGNLFMKLKVIEMVNMSCETHELEFAKFMLLNSPVLEKMELSSTTRIAMKRKVRKLPRASARAQVTFHRQDKEVPF